MNTAMENHELKNRERRMRRKAAEKGLVIQKETHGLITGYLICKEESRLVVAEYNRFRNLLLIEEAETFIEEYEM